MTTTTSEQTAFLRSVKERLGNDSRLYCTILEKFMSHSAFTVIAEGLRQILETEMRFALKELLRIKESTNKDLRLRPTLEANMSVFKENVKLALVAAVERISAGTISCENVERAITKMSEKGPPCDSIVEVDEDNLSDTFSHILHAERSQVKIQEDALCNQVFQFQNEKSGGQGHKKTADEEVSLQTRADFYKKGDHLRKSPCSIECKDVRKGSLEAHHRVIKVGLDHTPPPLGSRPYLPLRCLEEMSSLARHKNSSLARRKLHSKTSSAERVGECSENTDNEKRVASKGLKEATFEGLRGREKFRDRRCSPLRTKDRYSSDYSLTAYDKR